MKYIFVQPALGRFAWELRTAIKSLQDLGVQDSDIVILFSNLDQKVINEFSKYDIHVYNDYREDKSYIPSIRPYLWWKYMEEIRTSNDVYVYLDSDTVILDLDAFNVPVTDNTWYCSDTIGYIGYDYLTSVTNADNVINAMSKTTGVSVDWIKSIQDNSGGAQWVIKNPTVEYWRDVYYTSVNLYKTLLGYNSSIQKWTAEMWAQLWLLSKYNIEPCISKKLDFAWSTDNELKDKYIVHNAGVDAGQGLFFKGQYQNTPPLEHLYQNTGKVSDIYVEHVRKANY